MFRQDLFALNVCWKNQLRHILMPKILRGIFIFPCMCIAITAVSQIQDVGTATRLARISYLIDGVSPHCIFYQPSKKKKGSFYLEYWYKRGEKVFTVKEAKDKMSDWQQLIIAYGLGDSVEYFDTSFVKFVLVKGKLPYNSRWGFPLGTITKKSSDEMTRLLSLMNILPFEHRELYTGDSVFVWLYRIPTLSPQHNLENYSLILSSVIQSFVFDRPGRVICVCFFDERKKWLDSYVSDPAIQSVK